MLHKWKDVAQELLKLNSCIAFKHNVILDDIKDNNRSIISGISINETYFGNKARINAGDNGYTLIENYKMHLYTKDKEISNIIGSVKTDILFVNGLKHLKNEAMQFLNNDKVLRKLGYNVRNKKKHEMLITVDDVQWILTVPAIWDDRAKQKMREWGIQAGLLRKHYANHLKIVLEPECASLQTQQEFKDEFKNGDNYIVIDAGGGTVDIVCHQVFGTFGAKEIITSEGGPFGSINIDKKLWELFKIVFDSVCGNGTINKFADENHESWVKLFENIIQSKRDFFKYGNEHTSIGLKESFMDFIIEEYLDMYSDKFGENLDDEIAISNIKNGISKINNIFGIKIDNGKLIELSKVSDYTILKIHCKIWKYLFNNCCINETINMVTKQLKKMKESFMKCDYIHCWRFIKE